MGVGAAFSSPVAAARISVRSVLLASRCPPGSWAEPESRAHGGSQVLAGDSTQVAVVRAAKSLAGATVTLLLPRFQFLSHLGSPAQLYTRFCGRALPWFLHARHLGSHKGPLRIRTLLNNSGFLRGWGGEEKKIAHTSDFSPVLFHDFSAACRSHAFRFES